MMQASIAAIEYHLPARKLTTEMLAELYPAWMVEKLDERTGIRERRIAADDECASDLAFEAASRLFDSGACVPGDIDFVLLCTQSPDYALPSTACLLQERLSIPVTAGALDYNLGCSGFVYGLGLAQGLISTGQASKILLLTGDTYSKYISPDDRTTRPIFGDGAAATLIKARAAEIPYFGPFVYGTDGKGANKLIARKSGCRDAKSLTCDVEGNKRPGALFMDGKSMVDFVLSRVPDNVAAVLNKAKLGITDIDLFVFHQANAYLIEELRRVLNIHPAKIQLALSHCANTVSSTIPIALKHAALEGRISDGSRILISGFGVGYSWGGTIIHWGEFY